MPKIDGFELAHLLREKYGREKIRLVALTGYNLPEHRARSRAAGFDAHLGAAAKRRVLVVEDNLDTVHSLAMLIRMMGHECQFAINGFAALDAARKFTPHVVLLDIGLPDFKGYEIARQLKYEPGLEHTRIIAITALPEADRQRALDSGCDEFYRKPLDPALVEQLLAKRFGRDDAAPNDAADAS